MLVAVMFILCFPQSRTLNNAVAQHVGREISDGSQILVVIPPYLLQLCLLPAKLLGPSTFMCECTFTQGKTSQASKKGSSVHSLRSFAAASPSLGRVWLGDPER